VSTSHKKRTACDYFAFENTTLLKQLFLRLGRKSLNREDYAGVSNRIDHMYIYRQPSSIRL